MPELHLVGTLPQDPDGAERLMQLLGSLRPGAIAVEDHAAILQPDSNARTAATDTLAGVAARISEAGALAFWEQRIAPEQVHFQAFTCAAYAQKHGVPLYFLGDDGAESDSVGDATALAQLDAVTLRRMATFDWRRAYADDYAWARRELEAKGCIEFLVPLEQHRIFYERERSLSMQLEHIRSTSDVERLAFVCGVPHLYFSDAGLTVYMQLGQGTARRYLTDGAGEVQDYAIAHPC